MRAIAYAVVFVGLTAVGGLTYFAQESGQTELLPDATLPPVTSPPVASPPATADVDTAPTLDAAGHATGGSTTPQSVASADRSATTHSTGAATASGSSADAASADGTPVKRISQDGRIRLTPMQLASAPVSSDTTVLESLVEMVPEETTTEDSDRPAIPPRGRVPQTGTSDGERSAVAFTNGPMPVSNVSDSDLQTLQQALQQISTGQVGGVRSANQNIIASASTPGVSGVPRLSGSGGSLSSPRAAGAGGAGGGGGLPGGRSASGAPTPASNGGVLQALESSVAGPTGSIATANSTAGAGAANGLVAAADPSKFGIPNAQFWAFDFTAGTSNNGDMNGDGIIDAADARIQFDAYLTYLQSELDSDENLQVVRNSVDDLSQIFDEFNEEAATKQDPDLTDAVSENFVSYMIIEFDTKGFYLPNNSTFQDQVSDSNAWQFEANPDPGLNP